MKFQKSIIDTIRNRKSIRTYDTKAITEKDFEKIRDYINDKENLIGPLGGKARIEIVPVDKDVTDKGLKVGTYGFIKNPKAFIVGIMDNDKTSIVEFGYVFEKLILYLTELGLGTCWLGGTFSRNSFEKELDFGKEKVIPCVTPIGYPKDKERLFQKTVRFFAKSDSRKPWEELFYYSSFDKGIKEEEAESFKVPIEMVRLGPSASNKQPWRILLSEDKNSCHFYLEATPNYSGNKIGFQMQRIDMGIAMCHFDLACRELNMSGEWIVNNPKISLSNENIEYIASWKIK